MKTCTKMMYRKTTRRPRGYCLSKRTKADAVASKNLQQDSQAEGVRYAEHA